MSVRPRKWTNAKGEVRQAFVCDYTDAQGVRRLKTFKRQKDAKAFEAEATQQILNGTHVPTSTSKSVAEAGDLWLETAKAAQLDRATIQHYENLLRLHIKPFVGGMKLAQITVPVVRLFEDKLRQEGRSPSMIARVVAALGSIMADAQDRGLAAHNAVRERSRSRKGKKKSKGQQKRKLQLGVDIPRPDEVAAIIKHADSKWRPLLMISSFTGLRASELRGLIWSNVDLKNGLVYVRQRANRFNEIDAPKSEAGEREVPIGPQLANTLREWKAQAKHARPSDYVFGNGKGNIERLANWVDRALVPTMIRAGVTVPVVDENGKPILDDEGKPVAKAKYTGWHAFRHFYASWCINRVKDGGLGLPPKMVQERLGHATITLTMDRYGHLFKADDAEELAKAEEALLG